MKRKVFVDTGYFLALLRKRDSLHEAAVKASGKYDGPFVTTDLVLVEIANALSLPSYRASAVSFLEKIRFDQNTTVVSFGPEGMSKAFTFYKDRPDKEWGLVDCFSFVTMEENKTRIALTFDEHFRQAGFEVPLLVL
ncbi:MAG: type II toxin-antitoxin system VapC family toxin [Deltaproteobacteria bacterium]|nr:type II toxin-antitoxin system VapC family toxin [Deltaproteobacteria bacterium]